MRVASHWMCALATVLLLCSMETSCYAVEPGWANHVVKRGAEKELSQATPILLRPYRPLHFYGNTVRRRHYRGSARITLKDMWYTVRGIAFRAN